MFDLNEFDFSFLIAVVQHASSTDLGISLFNKCHEQMNEDQIRQVLSELPSPYSTIAEYCVYPKIKKTQQNLALADWLQKRGVISSWE